MKKLPKEGWLIVAVAGFVIAYLIDRVSGPVSIVIGNPIAFLTTPLFLNKFPLTATAILIRSLSIFISIMVIFEFFSGKYFQKAVLLFFIGLLGEFYAIQQLSSGLHITTIQWTLSIAYASLSLAIGIVWMLLMAIWSSFHKLEPHVAQNEGPQEEKSVLEPSPDDK